MTAQIPLSNGGFAIVDQEDVERLSAFKWFRRRNHGTTDYALTTARGPQLTMHRVIMGAVPGQFIDHINGDGLDNRKANLRFCSIQQNAANMKPRTGGRKGVSLTKHGTYRAFIHVAGKQIGLGHFASEDDAARAYDRAAKEHFGEFAWTNFPAEASR